MHTRSFHTNKIQQVGRAAEFPALPQQLPAPGDMETAESEEIMGLKMWHPKIPKSAEKNVGYNSGSPMLSPFSDYSRTQDGKRPPRIAAANLSLA